MLLVPKRGTRLCLPKIHKYINNKRDGVCWGEVRIKHSCLILQVNFSVFPDIWGRGVGGRCGNEVRALSWCTQHGLPVEARGQPCGVSSLLSPLHGFQGQNARCETVVTSAFRGQ